MDVVSSCLSFHLLERTPLFYIEGSGADQFLGGNDDVYNHRILGLAKLLNGRMGDLVFQKSVPEVYALRTPWEHGHQ